MNRNHLIQSARDLQSPGDAAARQFAQKGDVLAAELNSRMEMRPDLDKLIGPDNRAMMTDNSRNFTRFMASLFRHPNPEVFVDTVLWVFRAYRAHGFETTYWAANIDTYVEVMREHLDDATFAALYPFFDWLIVNIPVFVILSETKQTSDAPPSHGPL